MGSDDFWILLSFLTLPVKVQIEKMGGLPEYAGKIYNAGMDDDLLSNPSLHLIVALNENSQAWLDEFSQKCKCFMELDQLINTNSFNYSFASYKNDENWKKLRLLARRTLDEAGLEALELEENITFLKYVHDDRNNLRKSK